MAMVIVAVRVRPGAQQAQQGYIRPGAHRPLLVRRHAFSAACCDDAFAARHPQPDRADAGMTGEESNMPPPIQPDPSSPDQSFPTDPSGLPAATKPALLEVADGDTVDLRIGPVANALGALCGLI
jgi:hypothetical protein